MMALPSKRSLLALGALLIVLANAVVLLHVWANRKAPPESSLVLSQRELTPAYEWTVSKEDSGLDVRFDVRTDTVRPKQPDPGENGDLQYGWNQVPWLTVEKMRSLGYRLSSGEIADADRRNMQKLPPKEVYVALELDGDSYRHALQETQQDAARDEQKAMSDAEDKALAREARDSRERADAEQNTSSRLFCIDVAIDAAALRKLYGNRSRIAIARGTVQPTIYGRAGHWHVAGQFSGLRIPQVNVPLRYRQAFGSSRNIGYEPLAAVAVSGRTADPDSSHYEVTVAWGHRFEPWIVDASAKDR
jgi:hypothetical protein